MNNLYKLKNFNYFCDLLKKNNYSFFIFSFISKNEYLNILEDLIFHIKYLNMLLYNFDFKGNLYIYMYNPNEFSLSFKTFETLCLQKEWILNAIVFNGNFLNFNVLNTSFSYERLYILLYFQIVFLVFIFFIYNLFFVLFFLLKKCI